MYGFNDENHISDQEIKLFDFVKKLLVKYLGIYLHVVLHPQQVFK